MQNAFRSISNTRSVGVFCAAICLSACAASEPEAPQQWVDVPPDVTAQLRWGADQRTYALGGVTDYISPSGSDAKALVYIKRADGGTERVAEETASAIATQFGNVTLCDAGRAGVTAAEPPVYRRDINTWAVALSCA